MAGEFGGSGCCAGGEPRDTHESGGRERGESDPGYGVVKNGRGVNQTFDRPNSLREVDFAA